MTSPESDAASQALTNAVAGPAEAAGDAGSVKQQPLQDLIEVDKYLRARDAAKRPLAGLRFTKLVPRGTPDVPAILGPDGRPARPPNRPAPGVVRARYDAAQTNADNSRLWADADGLSARAANAPEVRRILRNRARYERSNNSYLEGIVQTLANDTIGTGPRLQLLTPDAGLNRAIEREFSAWADAVGLAEQLRVMRMSRVVDGEAFALLTTNPGLPTSVQLDVRLLEADQVATPDSFLPTRHAVDGIVFDPHGNPAEYHVLRDHPGDLVWFSAPWQYDRIAADVVIHWYRRDRPGQARGIPEITAAIADFSELRRFSKAVLAAAETAAEFAAMLHTTAPADGDFDKGTPFESIPIERRMLTTLPEGYQVTQLRAEQPTTSYPDFENQKVNGYARCLNMPRNVALGNSSGYNYASGRLDHQVYFKSVRVDQSHLAHRVLDPILMAWLKEFAGVARRTSPGSVRAADWPHQWFFDGQEHVDPLKEASAQEARLRNRTTTYAEEYARQGRDWEAAFEQIAIEQRRLRERNIEPAPAPPTPPTAPASPSDGEDDGLPIDD